MSVATQFIKDPNARLDYGFDWSEWLNGDTITNSTWIVTAGLTSDTPTNTTTVTKIWLSAGTLGELYTVTNRITTAAGRIDDRSFTVFINNR